MFILLHGNDEFSAREELARLRVAADFGYNSDTFSGAEVELGVLRATCETLPFLSERRLVVLEGLPKPKRGKGDKGDGEDDEASAATPAPNATKPSTKGKKAKGGALSPKAFAQALADFIPQAPETTTLVALVEEPLDKEHPLVAAARRYGKEQSFTTPRGAELERWLARRATAQGARLDAQAARLLASEIGENLRLLASEIDKLATYVGKGGDINSEVVRLLTPASRQMRIFDLTDALAQRDRKRALALLHELLAAGESPLGIVALTATQTRALLQVKSLAESGMRPFQIAQTAGIAPFAVEKHMGVARQLTFSQIENTHRMLLEIDTALKRSRLTPDLALDLLALEFGG